ncbi:phospholipid-binding lipoprotein MlaA [Sphingomonas zeicaulis]|uniref:MlaA family lipoprotein n=1 Tax=Sphingomonas zeicaulis TaxID=1632740 RepID=UPI003D214A60
MTLFASIIAVPLVGIHADLVLVPASPAPAVMVQAAQIEAGDLPSAEPPQPAQPQDGTIVVTARSEAPPSDPLRGINAQSFAVVQSVDEAVTGPVARAYSRVVPSPVRSGLRNALGNLQEPIVALNYLLQLKPGKSAETLGRFAINSTIGVAGLFDVAKRQPFNLPRRNNGFGYTLGYYGVKPGPYLYLPLMGPTTVRDLVGRIGDLSVLPVAVGRPFDDPAFVLPTTTIRLVDERAQADGAIRRVREGAADPYAAVRENYLRTRQAEIDALHGRTASPTPTER